MEEIRLQTDNEEPRPAGAREKIANAQRYADGQQGDDGAWRDRFRLNPFFIILLIVAGVLFYNSNIWRSALAKNMQHPPLSLMPEQVMLAVPKSFEYKGYHVTEVASYSLTARVLSHERYYFDRESDLSPVDLALGWGLMTNNKVLSQISVSQGGRFYHWDTSDFPMPEEQIISNSANNHIIPATDAVRKTVESLYTGEWVALTGYLVNISAADGWYWNTSLTRTDTGPGACEVFYVETAKAF